MEKFETIKQFISFNKRVKGQDGQSVTISINIPEMSNEQLVDEVKYVCGTMQSCLSIMEGKVKKVNAALAATSGSTTEISTQEASRQFEKGFGILVKLNNEIVVRGISDKVTAFVQETLGRSSNVDPSIDKEQLMLM